MSYGSTTKDNVVTYVAELQVDNNDLTLRPGMTATALIVAAERSDALLVPNAALRFTPAAAAARAGGSSIVAQPDAAHARQQRHAPRRHRRPPPARQVWVLQDGTAARRAGDARARPTAA